MRLSQSLRPPPPGKRNQILVPKHPEFRKYVVLSRKIWVGVTHWVDGRSVECTKSTGECLNCKPEGRARWTGYVHVVQVVTKEETFLLLPHGTVFGLLSGLPDEYDLRGKAFDVRRAGKGKTAPLEVRIDPYFQYQFQLPAEKDPSTVLRALMQAKPRVDGPSLSA